MRCTGRGAPRPQEHVGIYENIRPNEPRGRPVRRGAGPGAGGSAQDFTLTLQPSTVTLIPEHSASFVVSMTPLNGFTSQVALAVESLPFGVTAQFSPQTLSLPGTSVLELSAATNAALGSFTLDISAAGGGITNTTSSDVTVSFGLLPTCTGAIEGQVTDIVTGLPVPGAIVVATYGPTVLTDTNGMYVITDLALGSPDNTPVRYGISASGTNYWPSVISYAYAVCDATNVVNFQLLRMETGSVSGRVVAQGGGPLAGVLVQGRDYSGVTDTNGAFHALGLELASSNAPISWVLTATLQGYWDATTNVMIAANSNSTVTVMMIPICTGTVRGKVIFADSGLPATNVTVYVSAGSTVDVPTDSNGDYIATNVSLGRFNEPISASAHVQYPGYYYASTNALLNTCGEILTMPTLALQPLPADNYGAIAGHVYDVQTGQPITNAEVEVGTLGGLEAYDCFTDAHGAYFLTNVVVGTGHVTNSMFNVTATGPGYWNAGSNVILYASEIVTQDVRMLLAGYGAVVGTVRDSATALPIQGASVNLSSLANLFVYTDAKGYYASGLLPLFIGNAPTSEAILVQADGYWSITTNTTITQGNTNVVDVNLIKVCTGATIVGNVVDALTQKPITNAILSVYSTVSRSAMTDTKGSFTLTNITVGTGNSPIQVSVHAAAPGYNPQSKTVTIFCDATIITEFGVPETVFGGIQGYVTNVVTRLPLTNVFVGTGFGAATTTDTNGYYSFSQAPLGANGSSRVWTVTAMPEGFPAQTESASVSSNTVSRLDFGFGQPPTSLVVTAVGTPNPVTIGSNLLYVVTLTNTVADAQGVELSDTLPPGVAFVSAAFTNSPGTPFSAPIYSNNVVSTTAAVFGSNSAVALAIMVTPTVTGTLTNVAAVSSSTPDLDPTGRNHTATFISSVLAPAQADLALILTQSSNSIVLGSNLSYTLLVTNLGPADAPDVVLDDTLPAGAHYVGSTASQGAATPSGSSVHWDFGALSSHAFAAATLVIAPSSAGTITNTATASLVPGGVAVFDPNLANNTASIVATVTAPVVTNVAPRTALIVGVASTPSPVTVGSNLLYVVTLTNTVADAQAVELSDTLPPGVAFVSAAFTNSPGTPFSAPIYSNNVVSTTAALFGSNSAVALAITVAPTITGMLTNVATVSSSTLDLDPTGSNHTATVISSVLAPAQADLALILTQSSNSIVLGSNLSYTLLVTNLGPAGAPDVVLDDTLPAGARYVSSTASQGAATPSGSSVHWDFGAMFSHGFAVATLVVAPSPAGTITNTATATLVPAGAAVFDPNLANNIASIVVTVTAPVVTNVAVQALGPITFNPQTGLYQQSVLFTNLSGVAATAVRVAVPGLPSSVVLYNASGSAKGTPYVEYDQTIAAGGGVVFLLEYYAAARQPFVSTNFVATVVAATTPPTPSGTILQLDCQPFMSQGLLTIEFASVPGHTYVVQYSTNAASAQWKTAVPPILAAGTKTQWIDSGPPKTDSPPGPVGQRFYRVVQTN